VNKQFCKINGAVLLGIHQQLPNNDLFRLTVLSGAQTRAVLSTDPDANLLPSQFHPTVWTLDLWALYSRVFKDGNPEIVYHIRKDQVVLVWFGLVFRVGTKGEEGEKGDIKNRKQLSDAGNG
jgi:hypothetical protein